LLHIFLQSDYSPNALWHKTTSPQNDATIPMFDYPDGTFMPSLSHESLLVHLHKVVPNFLHFRKMEATELLGASVAARKHVEASSSISFL